MSSRMTICHAERMAQMTLRLDDRLAETAKAEAAAAGQNLSDWVRDAILHQARLSTALRARAEEDARGPLYTPEQEDALLAERQRRAVAAFDR
jgi:hypothetical protein